MSDTAPHPTSPLRWDNATLIGECCTCGAKVVRKAGMWVHAD